MKLTKALLAFTVVAFTHSAIPQRAIAQEWNMELKPYSSLKTLQGFQPSILESTAQAQKIYDALSTENFLGRSGCFQRAHQWAYGLNKNQNISSMKVFLFFTRRYQREFEYKWFYHVAPVIPTLVPQADGSNKVEELVFDPTFTSAPSWSPNAKGYDNGPVTVERWIKYFIYPNLECPLIENYADYENNQEQYYCYIMKTPMYTYIPQNIEMEGSVRTQWDKKNLENMMLALPANERTPSRERSPSRR